MEKMVQVDCNIPKKEEEGKDFPSLKRAWEAVSGSSLSSSSLSSRS